MAKVTTVLYGELAILPVQATVPVKETLEWLTDLQTSKNGTENPVQLRSKPRRTLNYSVPQQPGVDAAAFTTEYGALRLLWGVPLWAEAQRIGVVAPSVSALPCTTTGYDFRDSSLALLYQSPTQWQVLEITTLGPDVLNLDTATEAFTNAYLMPLRVGYVVGAIDRQSSGYGNTTELTFDIEDTTELDAGDAPQQFLTNDIYFVEPLIEQSLTRTIDSKVEIVDGALGKVARRAPWTYNRIRHSHRFVCEDQDEVYALRQWLGRRLGRLRRYWEPSFAADIRKASTGALTTTIVVKSDDLLDYNARTQVAFELDDGTWLPRTITNATQLSATQVQLTLDTSLAVNASRIRRISWLGLKRLEADRVQIEWVGGGVAKAAVNVLEISPDIIDAYLTTDPLLDQTVLLIHVEATMYNRVGDATLATIGAGAISSAQSRFGTRSFDNPGTETEDSNYVRASADADVFVFPGEFTWEAWVRVRSLRSVYMNVFANSINYPISGFIQLAIPSDGYLLFNSSAGSLNAASDVVADEWFHLAVCRDDADLVRIFKDGILQNSGTVNGQVGANDSGASYFDIGRGHNTDNADFDGWFEEVRVTKACRYTANFVPPTALFRPTP